MLKTSKAFDQAATMEAYASCALRNIISRFESISPYHKVGFFIGRNMVLPVDHLQFFIVGSEVTPPTA